MLTSAVVWGFGLRFSAFGVEWFGVWLCWLVQGLVLVGLAGLPLDWPWDALGGLWLVWLV